MAVIAVTNNNISVQDFEAALSPTVVFDSGSGKASALEAVTFFEGVQSQSRKVTSTGTTINGTGIDIAADTPALHDVSTGEVIMAKFLLTDQAAVNDIGLGFRVGSSSANLYRWIIVDDGTLGDRSADDVGLIRGGWIAVAIEPSNLDWFDVLDGSAPTLTAITHFQVFAGLSVASAKSENIFLDAIDISDGLFMVGGTSTDPDGTWQDFVDADQGTTASRFGHVLTNASGIEIRGKMIRGRDNAGVTTTGCVFTDALQNITWVGDLVSAGWNELEDDLTDAATVITEVNTAFTGKGRNNLKRYFDTDHEVNATDDVIEVVDHGFLTGEAVLFSDEGGSETPGPTDAVRYFVNRDTGTGRDADGFSLHATRDFAYANTSPIGLTESASGSGENHSLRRQPDTRPDYTAIAATGAASYTGCNFVTFRNFIGTGGLTMTSCILISPNAFTLGGATLTTCTFVGATTSEGESMCTGTVANVEAITSTSFTAGTTGGHAVEVTGSVSDLDISGIVFNNYGPDPESGNGHSFDTTDGVGVDDTNDEINYTTHGWTTGDPAYYSRHDPTDGSLGTDAIGMADGDLVYVRSVDANNFSLHTTRFGAEGNLDKIVLNATGTGETHTFYSADAAIVNNTAGDMTVNVSSGGNTPSIRNILASITTVVSSVSISITGLTEGSRGVMIGDGGGQDGVELLGGYATAAGVVTGSFSGVTPQDVIIKARNGGIINAAIQENFDAVFTDFTDAAREKAGSDDVDLLPAVPVTNDAFFFGGLAQFQEILINITTIGSGNTITWEYSTGADAWSALSVTDGTSSFENSGWNTISFTSPNDWDVDTVNSQGPFFYVRARVTSVSTPVQPQAEEITLNDTIKYLPFESTGEIIPDTGLASTAVWQIDTLNP